MLHTLLALVASLTSELLDIERTISYHDHGMRQWSETARINRQQSSTAREYYHKWVSQAAEDWRNGRPELAVEMLRWAANSYGRIEPAMDSEIRAENQAYWHMKRWSAADRDKRKIESRIQQAERYIKAHDVIVSNRVA